MLEVDEVEEDKFKPVFKYYKRKVPPPSLEKVLDLSKLETLNDLPFLSRIPGKPGLSDHIHLNESNLWWKKYWKNVKLQRKEETHQTLTERREHLDRSQRN